MLGDKIPEGNEDRGWSLNLSELLKSFLVISIRSDSQSGTLGENQAIFGSYIWQNNNKRKNYFLWDIHFVLEQMFIQ